jgi:hypothetical protein
VKSSSSGLSSSRGHVLEFANNVVGIDKDAQSVDARRMFVFSDKLTSTPSVENLCVEIHCPRPSVICPKDDVRVTDENSSKSLSSSSRSSDSSETCSTLNVRGSSPLRERSVNNVLADINSFMKNCSSAGSTGNSRRMGPFPYQSSAKNESNYMNRVTVPGSPMGNNGKKRSVSTPTNISVKRNRI